LFPVIYFGKQTFKITNKKKTKASKLLKFVLNEQLYAKQRLISSESVSL